MNENPTRKASRAGRTFVEEVGTKAARKLGAQRKPTRVWFGLGMMGLIGWSVAVPTVLGAALGLWLDQRDSRHSWTLALLMAGLVIGCLNAWHWVAAEDKTIREENEDRDG
jgi:ATP synthase protein I